MGRKNNTKSVQDLISRARNLRHLASESRQLDSLNRLFLSRLPSMLSNFCQVLSYHNGKLVIETQSNAAASQLRFITPNLVQQLKKTKEFAALQNLEFKVAPTKVARKPQAPIPKPFHVSSHNRQLLEQTADSVTSVELADSLRKLAKTLGKQRKN